jgi:hypothetical protein
MLAMCRGLDRDGRECHPSGHLHRIDDDRRDGPLPSTPWCYKESQRAAVPVTAAQQQAPLGPSLAILQQVRRWPVSIRVLLLIFRTIGSRELVRRRRCLVNCAWTRTSAISRRCEDSVTVV